MNDGYYRGCFYFSDTYYLGKSDRFNDQLADRNKKFTYFVPRDKAWRDLEILYPSTHKKLFMREFSYHVSLNCVNFDNPLRIEHNIQTSR